MGHTTLNLARLGLATRQIPLGALQKLRKIGSGASKDVFKGSLHGRLIAISQFRDRPTALDIQEIKLLGLLEHKNTARFVYRVNNLENAHASSFMVVSELCSNGDLFDYIRNVQAPPLLEVVGVMLDVAHGLEYLHLLKPTVIHRDCKSSNILITSDGTAKITDFGLAQVKHSQRLTVEKRVGTVNWQAPELWKTPPKYNHKVDVFSCGMVYWEILQWHRQVKQFPWEEMNEHAIYETGNLLLHRLSMKGLRKRWSPALVSLIQNMWVQDPKERLTMSEVVEALENMIPLE
ncbi:kinase-like domain-containing protein [Mycena olivaceomarginata]|nr:kinase-like domain-containing protein [Mycena olivaceomarginata]